MLKLIRRSKHPLIRHSFSVLCGAVFICLAWSWYSGNQQSAAEDRQPRAIRSLPPRPTPTAHAAAASESLDAKDRRMALGTWEDDYHGHRTLTLNEDGTATMIVEPEGLGATLFAKSLHFDIEWSIKDSVLNLKTLGGTPAKKIALISKIYGDEATEEILELTAGRFLVRHSEETDFEWRRVETPAK